MPPEAPPLTSLPGGPSVLDHADRLKGEDTDQQHFAEDGSLYSWEGSEGLWFSKQHEGFTSSAGFFSPSNSLEEGWRTASATTETRDAASRDQATHHRPAQGHGRRVKSSTHLLAAAFCLAVATALVLRVSTLRKRQIAAPASPEIDPVECHRAFVQSVAEFKAAWAAAALSTRRGFVATYLQASNVSEEAMAEVPTPFAKYIEAFTQVSLPAEDSKKDDAGVGEGLLLQMRTFTAVLQAAKHRLSCIATWQNAPKGNILPPLEDLLKEKKAVLSLSDFLEMLVEESIEAKADVGADGDKCIPSVLAGALLQEIRHSELQRQQDEEALLPFLSLLQQLSPSEAAQQEAQPGAVPGLPMFDLAKIREIVATYIERRRQQFKSVRVSEWGPANFTVHGVLDEIAKLQAGRLFSPIEEIETKQRISSKWTDDASSTYALHRLVLALL
ncbi:hypothetical protein Emed_004947 [Eimeria media]